MRCGDCDQFIGEYLEGRLGAYRNVRVRAHVTTCRRCAVRLAELTAMRRALRTLKSPAPRPDFWPSAYVKLHQRRAASAASAHTAQIREGGYESRRFRQTVLGVAMAAALPAALLLVFGHHVVKANATHSLGLAAALSGEGISADALIALHAGHNAALPLADSGRLRFAATSASELEIERDGGIEVR